MYKTLVIASIGFLAIVLPACVGSPVHSTLRYNSIQGDISRNNANMLSLKVGMTQDQVMEYMGQPERSEGYKWGSAWLYRTAMTSGIYGTADSDFTPVVLDGNGKLIGWGRNFFVEQVKRYDLTVKHE